MNRLFAGIAVTIMVLSLTVDAQKEYDAAYTVKAYALSEAQEAEYDQSDWRLTKFWRAWEADGANLDEVVLTGENCAWGACSPAPGGADVTYKIRMAYGANGVYVLHEITDDSWQDICLPNEYENDGVEFMTDAHSASELYEDQAALYIHSDYEITKSFTQIQIMFGGESPVEDFLLTMPEPGITVGGSYEGQEEFLEHEEKQIAETNEVLIKVLYYEATPNVRRQEWLVPWGIWGGNGVGEQSEGDKLAVTFGYNDLDECAQGAQPHALRWRNNADPYSIGGTVGSWGDVEFAGELPSTEAEEKFAKADNPVIEQPEPNSVMPRSVRGFNATQAQAVNTQYFTLKGQRIPSRQLSRMPATSVLIRRAVTTDMKQKVVREVTY